MTKYIVLSREEDSGEYLVDELLANNETEAKNKFSNKYGAEFARVYSVFKVGSKKAKIKLGSYIEVVKPHVIEQEDGSFEIKIDQLGAKGVVTTIYNDLDSPYFVTFVGEFEHLNEGLGWLWKYDDLKVL